MPDPIIDAWHPVSAIEAIGCRPIHTTLLDIPLELTSGPGAHRRDTGAELPILIRHGILWTSLGTPPEALFEIPEYLESDRRNLSAGPVGVATSAPRAIENFLDMAHFPFVHTGILGAESHTEVKDYDVEVTANGEIFARRCEFFQPMAALTAGQGQMVEYTYRVPHPFCAVLYKSCPADPARQDVIAIFAQATSQETIRAHLVMSMLDDVHSDTEMRRFQQMIFGQDKPILENQLPKRVPLDLTAEMPIRADKASIAYRRWLAAAQVNYGVIPAVQS
jgi:phenylpropionate dioxygenase-like ring-hydroxylating dioxygenase large terminal subunit